MQDNANVISIGVKPDLEMPVFDMPERNGYVFKGVYSEPNGSGYQYYTDNAQVSRIWHVGDPTTLYVYWIPQVYEISYSYSGNEVNPNPTTYTIEDEINLISLQRRGYDFAWDIQTIYRGTTGNIEVTGSWTPIQYAINYMLEDWKGNANPNPQYYTVEDEIVFNKLECDGYDFYWNPEKISKGTIDIFNVQGEWKPKLFHINYNVWNGTSINNDEYYEYGTTKVLAPAFLGGYFVTWDTPSIPAGTMGEVTIKASYVEKTLDQCYNNGVYEMWIWNHVEQLRNQPNGGYGRTYKVMQGIACNKFQYALTPISEFRGILDGNGYRISQFEIEDSTGGNLGLFRINYGTIKNLTIASRYHVESDISSVNVGFFAGVNKGTIYNCKTGASYNREIFRCFATGNSYAGCFVGSNEGTIENCSEIDVMAGSCNMGMIAGRNSGTIRNCKAEGMFSKIYLWYSDYNACIGGIVGLQTAGEVINCTFNGNIFLENYSSRKYSSLSEDREFQPCVGIMIGYKQGGTISGSTWSPYNTSLSIVYTNNTFTTVTWKVGLKKYSHTQGIYFKNEECGRIG